MNIEKKYLRYVNLLKDYNSNINIFSANAYEKLGFHIQDSVNIASILPTETQRVVDFGSGAGLPAVMIASERPAINVVAIESKEKKRKFIELTKVEYHLNNLTVFQGDIDSYLKSNTSYIDYVTAKAFSSYENVRGYLRRHRINYGNIIIPISQKQLETVYRKYTKNCLKICNQDQTFYYLIK